MQIDSQHEKDLLIGMASGFGPLRLLATEYVNWKNTLAMKQGDKTLYTLDQVIESIMTVESQLLSSMQEQQKSMDPKPNTNLQTDHEQTGLM